MQRRGYDESEEKVNWNNLTVADIAHGIELMTGITLDIIPENDLENALNISPKQMRLLREMGLPFFAVPRANTSVSDKRFYRISSINKFIAEHETIAPPRKVQTNRNISGLKSTQYKLLREAQEKVEAEEADTEQPQ
jgi:hypothetical protein